MTQIGLLICCLTVGYLLMQTRYFDERSPIVLNNLIVYFFIPVLTLYHVPKIIFSWDLLWLSITPFIIYLGSFCYVKIWRKVRSMDRPTEGALIMTAGIGSISFVGFPIFEILYGAEGLSYGIVLSLAGTFLVFNTLGLATGIHYAGTAQDYRMFVKRIFSFPPLIAFLLAVAVNVYGYSIPLFFDRILATLVAPFSVLALLAIGMQIDFSIDRASLNNLLIGQFYKLILAPVIIYLFLWHVIGVNDVIARVCLLGAAIGSMNAISIVAAQMGLNPRLASLMPALSIPLSIPLLFLIDALLT